MASFLNILAADWLEVIASLSGFICVYLTIKRNIWCWPIGLLQVILYVVIFYRVKLYSDVLLQSIYIVMQIYGWWFWVQGKRPDGEMVIIGARPYLLLAWAAATVAGAGILGSIMNNWTDAALPWADAFITVASLVAQWLLSRRLLINWLFWIAVDLVAIGTYWAKSLIPTTILYGAFLIMAISGLMIWTRNYREQALARG